jgi:hypothetical protein
MTVIWKYNGIQDFFWSDEVKLSILKTMWIIHTVKPNTAHKKCEENMLLLLQQWKRKTPWSESASKLYRPSGRRLSAKWFPTFVDRECHVARVTDSYDRILGFLDSSRYFSIK